MALRMTVLAAVAALASARQGSFTAAAVTPVEKVIDLLKGLQSKVESEGKVEAEQYDKFACFCKEQADNKQYAIERSTEKIAQLTAKETQLGTEISELTSEITALSASIKSLQDEIKADAARRATEHAAYKVQEADLSGAIGSLENAIAALKNAKGAQTSAKVDLMQIRVQVEKALSVASAMQMAVQSPAAYEYQSNDIISTLEELLKTFKENKKQVDIEEFDTQAAFDRRTLDLSNQAKFQKKDRAQAQRISEAKTAELNGVSADKTQETKEMTADQTFLAVVVKECEEKAGLWDQRSKTRSSELTAIAEALDLLENKVSAAYGANSKLTGLVQTFAQPKKASAKAAPKAAPAKAGSKPAAKAAAKAVSFLQLRGAATATAAGVAQRAAKVLQASGSKLHSNLLLSLAARLGASQDHFAKVRSLIKDLIAKLQDDKEAEASQKSFCDAAMAEAITARDGATAQVEQLTAKRSALEAEKASLMQQVAELSKAIANLKKALNEATELRNQESAENAETVRTATEGKAAVTLALKALNDFYNPGAALVQQKYVPEDADREGKNFADRAPEVFQGEYAGKGTESTGIIGLLDVILSDFERTIETVTAQEAAAAADYTAFAARTEEDIASKKASIAAHEARLSAIEDELVETADKLSEQEQLQASAKATLLDLKASCVDGEESYEERVAKRKQEIESLKEAKAILDEWKA